jgi:hypothetical protein
LVNHGALFDGVFFFVDLFCPVMVGVMVVDLFADRELIEC